MSACGDFHSLLLSQSGTVYFFGYNIAGSKEQSTHLQYTPESIERVKNAVFISCGPSHNAALCVNSDARSESTREVYLWGRGWDYQLANSKRETIVKPAVAPFCKLSLAIILNIAEKVEPKLVS